MYSIPYFVERSFPPLNQMVDYKTYNLKAGDTFQAISCQWDALREQLLLQWGLLTSQEIDKAGPRRDKLAALIQNKYGIKAGLAENYLRNFERVLPLM